MICLTENISAQSFLKTSGQDIVDSNGKKVYLQGVGLGNWMLPEGYMWKFGKLGDRPRRIEKIIADYIGPEKAEKFWKMYRKNFITEADIKRIAELRFNSVRPALNSRLFITEGENKQFVDEGFSLLDDLIKWCKKYHLYVIIDMHGAPGGQSGQNIDDSRANKAELFSEPKNQDLLVKLWVEIARRYKDEPTVAAYDLLNEPLPGGNGSAKLYSHLLVPLYQRLINAIREVDPNHMFTVEGYNAANNWSLFDKPLDKNIFYQFHYYCWDRYDYLHMPDPVKFMKKREELNTPIWVGETGEKNNAIYFATTQFFEKNNIGWSFWPWKKMDTQNTPYSVKPPKGWENVTTYSRTGEKAAVDNPEDIFNELLENIKLENSVFYPDVVNAMLRQIPLKIEAENYGHDGFLKSYFVKDTATLSSYYRKTEPVKVDVMENDLHQKAPGQFILLNASEWTAYHFKSLEDKKFKVSMRIKAVQQPSKLTILINGSTQRVTVSNPDWTEINLKSQSFKKGLNEMKVEVNDGSVKIDWFNIY
ncbi:MAG: cellulase family glycosylhydrolase [Bacteroidota bacterium]|nr:cellulase family glycosylhydrolase [Bacteroidota bacterium]